MLSLLKLHLAAGFSHLSMWWSVAMSMICIVISEQQNGQNLIK